MKQLSNDMLEIQSKLKFGNAQCLPKPSREPELNRRGEFKTVATGISYGGGQEVR